MQGLEKKLKILFLCTGNSCRSQVAEDRARYLKGDFIEPYSAGVDTSTHRSKPAQEVMHTGFNYAVTLCGHTLETRPVVPGKAKVISREFDDPARLAESTRGKEEALGHYRRVCDEIRAFVERLPDALETWDIKEDT